MAKIQSAKVNHGRSAELQAILVERRDRLISELGSKVRGVAEISSASGSPDQGEAGEANLQQDLEFALIQMKQETLHKIEEALKRLAEDRYGYCSACGKEISEARLRALPFAIRCIVCEETQARNGGVFTSRSKPPAPFSNFRKK